MTEIQEPAASPWTKGHSINVLREVAAGIVPSVRGFSSTQIRIANHDNQAFSAEWVIADGVRADAPVILYFHGGAHLCGHPEQYRNATVGLSRAAGARVLAPDYRLAPEHPFPAGFEDALASYQWLLDNPEVAPNSIAIAGDSAGAALAVAATADALAAGLSLPCCLLLNSPFADLSLASESLARPELNQQEPNRKTIAWLADTYLRAGNQTLSATHPRHSPVYRDLQGLPPMLIQTAGLDNLQDDGLRLAERARRSGVSAQLSHYPSSGHVWTVFSTAEQDPEARRALDEMASYLRKHL